MSLGKGTHLLSDVIGRIPENLMSLGKGTHLLSEVIGRIPDALMSLGSGTDLISEVIMSPRKCKMGTSKCAGSSGKIA